MVASPRDCGFCIVFGTLHRAATNYFRPRWKRPADLSPISDAMDLDGAPLQENRRANPANAPCLRRISGNVRLMDSDAKELGHMRAADRKTVWAYQAKNVIIHTCVGNSTPNRKFAYMARVLIRVRNRPSRERLVLTIPSGMV